MQNSEISRFTSLLSGFAQSFNAVAAAVYILDDYQADLEHKSLHLLGSTVFEQDEWHEGLQLFHHCQPACENGKPLLATQTIITPHDGKQIERTDYPSETKFRPKLSAPLFKNGIAKSFSCIRVPVDSWSQTDTKEVGSQYYGCLSLYWSSDNVPTNLDTNAIKIGYEHLASQFHYYVLDRQLKCQKQMSSKLQSIPIAPLVNTESEISEIITSSLEIAASHFDLEEVP